MEVILHVLDTLLQILIQSTMFVSIHSNYLQTGTRDEEAKIGLCISLPMEVENFKAFSLNVNVCGNT